MNKHALDSDALAMAEIEQGVGVAPGQLNPDHAGGSLLNSVTAAADTLQMAASKAVDVLSEVVPVAVFCTAVRRQTVELALMPERGVQDAEAVDAMAESLNRSAQQALSALRRMCDDQRVLMGHIETTGGLLMKLAKQMDLRETAIRMDRLRRAEELQDHADVVRSMARHVMTIDQAMRAARTRAGESF